MTATENLATALGAGQTDEVTTDVPIEYLDYEHITKCNKGKELEKILKVLRSGKEGRWPDLEKHCENRLSEVNPKSKLLRISTKLIPARALDEETRNDVNQDITDWLNSMNEKDSSLKKNKSATAPSLPGVRKSGNVVDSNRITEERDTEKKSNPARINSYDYRAWDRYNVDEECEKVDTEQEKKNKAAPPKPKPVPKTSINPEALTDPVSTAKTAEMEKNKGNEAFKSGDYEESINYYTNSIDIQPTAATYNNRGLAMIRLERFHKAILDFNQVLQMEPDNVKALLRRADAREKTGLIKEAQADLERSVIVDETNKRAKQLLEEFTERHKKLLTKGGKRMKIVESSSDEEEGGEEERAVHHSKRTERPTRAQCTRTAAVPSNPVTPDTKLPQTDTKPSETKLTESQHSDTQPSDTKLTDQTQSDNNATDNTPSATTESPVSVNLGDIEPEIVELKPPRQIIEILPLPTQVSKLKSEATSMFSTGMYGDAVAKYTACLDHLDRENPGYWYHSAVLLSNRAACKLKIGQLAECVKDCNESLDLNPRFFKSILRRAIAYEHIENYVRSYEDYRLTLLIDPSQVAAQQGLHRIGEVLRREFGSGWREKVAPHSEHPDGPDFVEPGTVPAGVPHKPTPKRPTPLTTPSKPATPSQPVPPSQPVAPSKPATTPPQPVVPTTTPAQEKEPAREAPAPTPIAPKPATPQSSAPAGEKKEEAAPKVSDPPQKAANPQASKPQRMPTREEQYAKFKDQGNSHVAKQQYREALKCYEKCITLNKELVPAHLNSALCHLKLGNYPVAVQCVEKVLKVEPHNIKALYRRAAANKELKKYPSAAKDLKFVVEKDPGNKPAVQLLEQVKRLWNNELRGMQGKKQQQQPAPKQPAPKGRKIPVIEASDSEESEEEEEEMRKPAVSTPVREVKREEPAAVRAEKVKTPQAGRSTAPESNKGPKPWMKKSVPTTTHNSEPQTAYSFHQHYTAYKKKKDIIQFGKVLESYDPQSFPKLFSSSIDADMVVAIVDAVDKYFVPNKQHDKALEILQAVTKAQRFDVMKMLMSQKDKTAISEALEKLEGDQAVIESIKGRFS